MHTGLYLLNERVSREYFEHYSALEDHELSAVLMEDPKRVLIKHLETGRIALVLQTPKRRLQVEIHLPRLRTDYLVRGLALVVLGTGVPSRPEEAADYALLLVEAARYAAILQEEWDLAHPVQN